ELGTGKTTLARGIGRGWGAARRVTSPTFTLIHEYPRARDGRRLYHVDCYRLTRAAEVETLALDDLLDQGGAMMIEWPEIIQAYLPADRLWMAMRHLNETRRGLRLTASGPRSTELLKAFRFRAFGIRD
ncbi:MAG: tRNA (adenosine(37)-N6)-threonylcarbamoyltransferase complex ATPase subunit type 1 TsaE, partial [Chloroflexota bacterium]